MNFTPGITLTEFKNDFYNKSKDFTLFDCGEINIIKIILDGLKVNYQSRGKIRLTFFYPESIWNFIQFAQRKRNSLKKELKENKKVKVLFADLSGRSETVKDSIPESFYFSKLFSAHKHEEYLHTVEYFKIKEYPHHLDFRDFTAFQYLPLTSAEKQLRKDLIKTYKKIQNSGIFSEAELLNIKIAIQSFFSQFKIWNEIIKKFPSLQFAVIEQHYHHEGLLLALKNNNIKSFEIQHGLISESDIFYVFPKKISTIKNKALFPDKILVYGDYWKEILLKGGEFNPEDIIVTGDFRTKNNLLKSAEEEKLINEFSSGKKIILICTQTFIHEFYCSYTIWLSDLLQSKYKDWGIILKLHPNEKEELYSSVSNIKNVLVSKANIHYLFGISKMHISVYSTTLFDALEYPLANFSLANEAFSDYTTSIIKDNIAQALLLKEDPVLKFIQSDSKSTVSSKAIYADFEQNKKNYLNLFQIK